MSLSLIVAHNHDFVIGCDNQLPWHISEDLKRFKRLTLDKTVVMGRLTYESIGRPLPHRKNIILTQQKDYHVPPEVSLIHDLSELDSLPCDHEIMIIGGGQLYRQTLHLADKLYITLVDHPVKGDAFFPTYDLSSWQLIDKSQHQTPENPIIQYQFLTYQRIKSL